MHTNKQFQISNTFKDTTILEEKDEFNFNDTRMEKLLKVKKMVLKLKNMELMVTSKKDVKSNIVPPKNFNDFQSNPVDTLININNELQIKGKSFTGGCHKSNLPCCFIFKGETFISWVSFSFDSSESKHDSTINIYNISKMNMEVSFPTKSEVKKKKNN